MMFDGFIYFFKMCWKYNYKYIGCLFVDQFLKVFLTILTLIFPQLILDLLFPMYNYHAALKYIGIFLVLTFILGVLISHLTRICNNEKTNTFHLFQLDLGKHMMTTKLEKIETEEFLNTKAKAEQYLYGAGQGFASILINGFNMVGTMLSLILYSAIISRLNIIVLIMLICITIIVTITDYYYQKKNIAINLNKAVEERRNTYYSHIFQDFQYGKEIRVNNLSTWLIRKYDAQLAKMQEFYELLNKNQWRYSLISLILSTLQQAISYIYLIKEVIAGNLTVGVFSLYLNSIISFNNSIKSLINQFITIRQYTDYYEAFKEYISTGSDNNFSEIGFQSDSIHFKDSNLFTIKFEDVSFIYDKNNYPSLENISIELKCGERIAIVGDNGAGKSTFIKLLLRIYEPTNGKITINGINISNIPYDEYISLFSTVFQDYKLFAQTIEENITFNDTNESSEELNSILKQVKMFDKFDKLPDGLTTNIYKIFDNNGYIPSEGEAQKLALSRAIYKNASIMVLDEPSSSLDPLSEFEMYSIVNELPKTKTFIFISHRLSISSIADRVFVFRDGHIIENGSHVELMTNKGAYYSMYTMQTRYYDIR